jgi:hypothetical protein
MSNLKELLGSSYRKDLSPEEINILIKNMDLVDKKLLPESPSKESFEKLMNEVSEYKRKEREKLSEEEKVKAEMSERLAELQTKLEQSERANKLNVLKSKFQALGYDEKLAENSANASIEQDYDKLFAFQQKFLESTEEAIKKGILSSTPRPKNVSSESQNTDYQTQIDEARKSGDNAAATTLISKAFEEGIQVR